MSFKASVKELLKIYWKCERVSSFMKIKFDSEPVYGNNDKHIKAKTKLYGDKVNTIFKVKMCQKKMHHTSVYHW